MNKKELKEIGCTPIEDLITEDFGAPGTAERNEFENSCEAFIIGEQLKAERMKAGLTQEQLAAKTGTKKSYPRLPYTHEERIESLRKAEENIAAGKIHPHEKVMKEMRERKV